MIHQTLPSPLLKKYHLDLPMSQYNLFKKDPKPNPKIDYFDMKKKWDQALRVFAFTGQEIDSIYGLVGLIGNVGNVRVERGVDEYSNCTIVRDESWEYVLELCGADGEMLEKFFMNKVTVIGEEVNFTVMRWEDCVGKVGVFARAVYYELFEWLVMRTDVGGGVRGVFIR